MGEGSLTLYLLSDPAQIHFLIPENQTSFLRPGLIFCTIFGAAVIFNRGSRLEPLRSLLQTPLVCMRVCVFKGFSAVLLRKWLQKQFKKKKQ